jgi:uncharacterized repeat protein (TIGR03803 family)
MAIATQPRKSIFDLFVTAAIAALAMAIAVTLTIALPQAAQAQTFTVLHNFTGGEDGSSPGAGLTIDRNGNLYGTAGRGGSGQVGTVFKLTHVHSNWVFTTLYAFQQEHEDGNGPGYVIFGPDGSLYGTTGVGGLFACQDDHGCGTVFKLTPPASVSACKLAVCAWTETVLHRFSAHPDGAYPVDELVFDQTGTIYGVTYSGGNPLCEFFNGDDCGVVYTLTTSGVENVIYTFPGGSRGSYPSAGVTFDQAGNLFGTTSQGGGPSNFGTAFELTPSQGGWVENTIYPFQFGSGGQTPYAGLILDQSGNLYGATTTGGVNGGGTVFELAPSHGSWVFSVLYSFTGSGGGGPSANLVMGQDGSLYGATGGDGLYGVGAVFKLTHTSGGWTYTSLHDFTGGNDGAYPNGPLVFDSNGNVYGTTESGGPYGYDGVVWEITP